MDSIRRSNIVCSLAGRDKGKCSVVLDIQDGYALLVDGKNRRLRNPKRKKLKHLRYEAGSESPLADRINSGEAVSNREVLVALAKFRRANGQMTEEGS